MNQLALIDGALSIDRVIEFRGLIEQSMARVMKENLHYGKIPGCGDKPTLLQPGAQLLCTLFRLRPEYEIHETDLLGEHKRFRITCRLYVMGEPPLCAGEGIGEASSMESKHRFRNAAPIIEDTGQPVPKDFWDIKKERGMGEAKKWLSVAFDGAPVTAKKFGEEGWRVVKVIGGNDEKVENPNPADVFNTVLKLAKKRAFVDATITATSSNDFFTQDLEDIRENLETLNRAHENTASEPAQDMPRADDSTPQEATEPKSKGTPAERHQKGKDAIISLCEKENIELRSFLDQAHVTLGAVGVPYPSLSDLPLEILESIWKVRKVVLAALKQPAQEAA